MHSAFWTAISTSLCGHICSNAGTHRLRNRETRIEMTLTQSDKAQKFLALHQTNRPLVLVNAWDVASARIVEERGFPAIATTSAGIAWAQGYADGERISRDEMLGCVERIVRTVGVPVTADLEGGYGTTVKDAVATAQGVIEIGAVGLNFEDTSGSSEGLLDADLQVSRIRAMREVATKHGMPLVINARTDVYLAHIGDNDSWRLQEACRRSNLYLQAGADVAFVPGVTDEKIITALISGIEGPLNVLAAAATPSIERLRQLGVARVSLGSGAMGYVLAQLRDIAKNLREGGSFEFVGQRVSHAEVNALLEQSETVRT
jgi:2-methylisocitrate lyase-like PEP mutase family enzyme